MEGTRVEIVTPDGKADARVFRPKGSGPWPAVLFFMDGIGVRDALYQMGARLAEAGYLVLLPNMYYREGPLPPFEAKTAFSDAATRERIMTMLRKVDGEPGMRDAKAFLDWLAAQPDVAKGPVGLVGYCLGGRLALMTAGTHPDRVAVAASIHGGRIGADDPASPLHLVPRMKAKIYAGVAAEDPTHTPEMNARLETALREAGVPFELEPYAAKHGFAVPDAHTYDAAAAEHHWEKVLGLFRTTLG